MLYRQRQKDSLGQRLKGNLIEFIQVTSILFATLILIRLFVVESHYVSGISMAPNFFDGDVLAANLLATKYGTLYRGEVIILVDPTDSSKEFIKRLIAFPGERIKIQMGKVWINDQILKEPYLPSEIETHGELFLGEGVDFTIPAGEYFVLGDNRSKSSDSRDFGPIRKVSIIGQVFLRFWPLSRFSLIGMDQHLVF